MRCHAAASEAACSDSRQRGVIAVTGVGLAVVADADMIGYRCHGLCAVCHRDAADCGTLSRFVVSEVHLVERDGGLPAVSTVSGGEGLAISACRGGAEVDLVDDASMDEYCCGICP